MFRPGFLTAADAAELNRLLARVRSLEGTSYAPPLVASGAAGGVRVVMLGGGLAGRDGTGLVLVLVTAPVPDPGWSQAQVQRFSADGSARLPASPTEVADVRPLSGGRLKANGYYACLDSGGKNAAVTPARRRLWAVTPPMKEVTIQTQVCSAQTGQTTLQPVTFWVLDV